MKTAMKEPYLKNKSEVYCREVQRGDFDFYIIHQGSEQILGNLSFNFLYERLVWCPFVYSLLIFIGTIRWKDKILYVQNQGSIPIFCLATGGGTNFNKSDEEKVSVIGAHGEGLKMAMLTARKLKKPLVIHTGRKP